jgi:hypothetical protein
MFKKLLCYVTATLLPLSVAAHEMTPTYFDITPSFINGVSRIEINIFNKREDVRYYEIQVFDDEWNLIESRTGQNNLVQLNYLEKKTIDIYISDTQVSNVELVCSVSKILSRDVDTSALRSRICSRIRRE